MAHYPGHKRASFQEWVEAECPDTATIEVDYEEQEVAAEELLRDMILPGCTDIMPGHLCKDIAEGVGVDRSASGMTYALGATVLLMERTQGVEAAGQFLADVIEGVAL